LGRASVLAAWSFDDQFSGHRKGRQLQVGGWRVISLDFPYFCLFFLAGSRYPTHRATGMGASIKMPAFGAFLFLCELRSGVALDPEWRAKYQKGSWQYLAVLTFHGFAVVLLSRFASVFIR
jgi:hypothetical protein